MFFFVGFPDKFSKRRPQKVHTLFFEIFLDFREKLNKKFHSFSFQFLAEFKKNNVCIFCGLLLENLSGNPTKKTIFNLKNYLKNERWKTKHRFSSVFSLYKKWCVDLVISGLLFPPRAHVWLAFCWWLIKIEFVPKSNDSGLTLSYRLLH